MSDVGKKTQQKRARRERAHLRLRARISGTAERPRLSVFKSSRYIYAQIIDDTTGTTLVAASSLESGLRDRLTDGTGNKAAAKVVGEAVAERAKEKGVAKVVFDRGGYVYHGKIKELADAARSRGLEF
jgi:large subunit ribosomal protein L18